MSEMIKELLSEGWDLDDAIDFVADEFNCGCSTVYYVWEAYNNK